MTDAEFNAACEELYQKGLPRPEWATHVCGTRTVQYRLVVGKDRNWLEWLGSDGKWYEGYGGNLDDHEAACLVAEHVRGLGRKDDERYHTLPLASGEYVVAAWNCDRDGGPRCAYLQPSGNWTWDMADARVFPDDHSALIKMGEILVKESPDA